MFTLVIADDEQRICDSIQQMISSAFPQVSILGVFHDGLSLRQFLQTNRVDMLITDIEMPRVSGLDIAKQLDAEGHPSYILMITAYQEFDYARRALESHVDSFLTKPYTTKALEAEVRKGLNLIVAQRYTSAQQWALSRSYLKALSKNEVQNQQAIDLYLCRSSVSLCELRCTEVSIHSENASLLDEDQSELLIADLQNSGESDTPEQSVLFLEKKNTRIIFLAFSKGEPDTSFLQSVLQVVQRYTGDLPHSGIRAFPSFHAFQLYRMFDREINTYFKIFSQNGVQSANMQANEFLLGCSLSIRNSFVLFLQDEYHAEICDNSVDAILSALSSVVQTSVGTRSNNYIVKAAQDYILGHFSDPSLSLDAVSSALAISSGYLSRIFKDETGQNFSEYIQTYRMKHAQHLLAATMLPVNAIAAQSGYSNSTYFRAAFKTKFGVTPRQFRQLNQ